MSGTAFPDHFSEHAARYAEFRPRYPRELYDFVASLLRRRELAWDCATGNGQAALDVARFVDRVIATDASAEQIAHARAHPRVEYRVATAEESGLADASVDLVTVAQAVHWFRVERFLAEAARVLRPGGILAVWGYGDLSLEAGPLDEAFRRFHAERVERFWPPERRHLVEAYRTLPFPAPELATPSLELRAELTLPRLAGYVGTWSAVRRYREAYGEDPVPALLDALRPAWGDPETPRPVRWPLFLRAWRAPG